jgi:putative membrane-bound dehydrogenase-like protein
MLRPALLALTTAAASADFPTPFNSEKTPGAPMPAEEAAAKWKVPPGFRVQVFAAEPDVQNPIACAWDARGRLWIAENYTYAERQVKWESKLRDRVLIFEDADGDGRHDKRTVFTDEVQHLTSVEVGLGGVWLMAPPQLLFIPDRNRDDVPDGPAEVVLDGFTVPPENHHNFANGLRWGPDGWLYGRVGASAPGKVGAPGTPDAERVPIAGGIWRYHAQRKVFEMLCHGTTNPWGSDWNEVGEMFFTNTVNGHLWHMIPGAHYTRPHTIDPNPHVYALIDQHADHYHFDTGKGWTSSRDAGGGSDPLGGGHAHCGAMIYLADNWPAEYRGKLMTLNFHGRRINVERLERHGSGYVGKHEPDICFSADPFFRGIDLTYGPDGGVFILDWSDTGECHENTGVHRTSGRIYKITHGQVKKPSLTDLTQLSNEELTKLLGHPNQWFARMAQRLLHEQTEPPVPGPIDTIDGRIRAATPLPAAAFDRLLASAGNDPGELGLASQLFRLPVAQRVQLAAALAAHPAHAQDHNLPLLVWQALAAVPESDLPQLLVPMQTSAWPQLRRLLARRLASAAGKQGEVLRELVASSTTRPADYQGDVLTGLLEGFTGWRKAPKPAGWDDFAAKVNAAGNAELSAKVRELSVLFGDGRALEDVRRIALDDKAALDARKAALASLIDARPDDLRAVCERLLGVRFLNTVAARGLARFDDPALGAKLAGSYKSFHPSERAAVIETLVARPAFAKALLDAVAAGKIDKADVTAFHARQIRSLGDAALAAQLAQVWGEVRDSGGDQRAQIAQLKTALTPAALAAADKGRGRAAYEQLCATCHTLYGSGGTIGPDLTGSGRANLDYLLENIVDPGAVVNADFRLHILTLKDGRVLNGMIAARTDRTLTVQTPTDRVTIERAEIVKDEEIAQSLMPEGQLAALTPQQVRDLIAYLMHPVQVPLPAQ